MQLLVEQLDDQCGRHDADRDIDIHVELGGRGNGRHVLVGETDVQNMYMTVDPTSVAAGTVTFTVTNEGVKKHEFVVLQTDANPDKLTVEGDEVVEDDYDSPGEIGDLPAGETDTLTLDLPAGKYVLICNLKGHYRMGMYAPFTVT